MLCLNTATRYHTIINIILVIERWKIGMLNGLFATLIVFVAYQLFDYVFVHFFFTSFLVLSAGNNSLA